MKILNIIKTLTLIDLFQGLIVTLKNFFRVKVTVQYPEVKTPISNRFRGKLALMKYENGEERYQKCLGENPHYESDSHSGDVSL